MPYRTNRDTGGIFRTDESEISRRMMIVKPRPLLAIRTAKTQQESYETGDPGLKQRARDLRRRGYKVLSSSMGPQVTPLGRMNLTMLSIDLRDLTDEQLDTLDIPESMRFER